MDEHKGNMWIIAIVAIVAIVALVVLVINMGGKQNYMTNGISNVGQATAVLTTKTATTSKTTTPQKSTSSSTPTQAVPTTMPRDNLYYTNVCEWCGDVYEYQIMICWQDFTTCATCFLPSGEIGDPYTYQSYLEYLQCMAPCQNAYATCETRVSADYYACLIGHQCGPDS